MPEIQAEVLVTGGRLGPTGSAVTDCDAIKDLIGSQG